jgi:hypothetical protein
MFNNVALNVVIGLIFIYLLYSLLATVLIEIIATKLGLRARNLKEAVDRMLNDDAVLPQRSWIGDKLYRFWDSVRLMKNPKNPRVSNFYDHPEIKYLGSSGLFKNPSAFKAFSFAKTLMYLLNGSGPVNAANIENELKNSAPKILGPETAKYVLSLWEDCEGKVDAFKLQLEGWFDRTMEQATEWYKRKIQLLLLILGFILAWVFNADTIAIVKKLSTDKDARGQMVQLAAAFVEKNNITDTSFSAAAKDSTNEQRKKQLASLLAVKNELETDIQNAGSLLGAGGSFLPDTLNMWDAKALLAIDTDLLPEADKIVKLENGNWQCVYGSFSKICYFVRVGGKHMWGFLITAIAISLGAPFWFDLLNKIMQLRASLKQPTDSKTV